MSNNLRLIYAAAHAGYDLRSVPLGGAAAVCEKLIRAWAGRPGLELVLIGPGEGHGYGGINYIRFPGNPPDLVHLSELEYADFSIRFELFVTDTVKNIVRIQGVQNTCFLSNDISEAGDFHSIREIGLPILTLYHVDVVEFFSKMYLKNFFPPERLTTFFDVVLKSPLKRLVPRILGLVFKKQRESLLCSEKVIVPSEEMKRVLKRCYPWVSLEKIQVIPWGGTVERFSQNELKEETQCLRRLYDIQKDDTVLMTLSRVSPEKGVDLFLKALILWEENSFEPPPLNPLPPAGGEGRVRGGMHVFICGEAAYMHGESYKRKLLQLSQRLKKIKIYFPGYVSGIRKRAFFELSDLYVFPSRHDSYGLTIVEALQAGLPVLTSSHHSSRDLVKKDWGEVVEWGRESEAPVKILRALQSLLSDSSRLVRMREKARETSKNWDFLEAADRILGLAKAIISPCPVTPRSTRNQV